MKKILGLDLGTTSIGWALVNEAETAEEKSSIIKLGVRVNPLTTGKGGELDNFTQGKSITTNADRTRKRSMRRNLQRYKLRRENMIEILKEHGFISDESILSENGNRTTFETYRLRAKAAAEEISLEQFARVLLMINKKRGYKSSRKAKGTEEGALIYGEDIAIMLQKQNLTVAQYSLQILQSGKKDNNQYYPSDLQKEFDRIWDKQKESYPEILTDELKRELRGKKRDAVYAICQKSFIWKEIHNEWSNEEARKIEVEKEHKLEGIYAKRKRDEAKIENLQWRSNGLTEQLSLEQLVIVLQEINGQIENGSKYLGKISDKHKELKFNKQTVGQYQMAVLAESPNASLRNMVFYRQDYLDEFNTIWEKQAEFHKELTEDLRKIIRDGKMCDGKMKGGIFFQRQLKSQKGLISFCEFESRQIEVEIDGKKKIKTAGSRVIPRSSPLFQEFKIWQILNNIEVSVNGRKIKRNKKNIGMGNLFAETEDALELEGKRALYQEEKELLAKELFVKEKLTKAEALKLLFESPQELDLNFKTIDGNRTGATLFQTYSKIIEFSGHEPIDFKKSADDIIEYVKEIFTAFDWNKDILQFDSDTELDKQPYYKLWHLLYSFEGDNTPTGNGNLIQKITECYGFEKEYATILANVTFQDDYGSLSAKAIRKILPHLKEGNGYDVACVYAGYEKHSKSSLTKEEIENKVLKDRLDILPKNSLRNPVVEKILNQMVNVINTIIDTYGKPDEIRVELARELKKNAKEREELTKSVADNTKAHDEYKKILSQAPFNLSHISRTDIVRYKLWLELKATGFKTLYSNTYISPTKLFTGEFDIEHIIPQARLFDDSFSNKTLEKRDVNIAKGNRTAYDFVKEEYGEDGLQNYLNRVEMLYNTKSRENADEDVKSAGTISKSKYNKLKMEEKDIPEGFIERDLRNTQYIAKKALSMLNEIARRVVATSGSITDELREDWQLINVMQELNWDKYNKLGLTEIIEIQDKQNEGAVHKVRRIKDWTKRNDHRHHAMDALTVAFTKDVYIQYFNNKNASFKANTNEYAIKNKYFDNGKAVPPMPLNEFRAEAKKHLENTLISIKAKNKVVTQNINTTKKNGGTNKKLQSTPRGQLHKETIYGSHKEYVKKTVRGKTSVTMKTVYTVRKEIVGSNPTSKQIVPELKNLKDFIDAGIREILKKRLEEYENDPKKAFSNLAENPIWLNKEKGISIKRVTISGINNAESLHEKKDKDGNVILDSDGKKTPIDFVNTGNNHHVAVYRKPVLDKKGEVVREENGEIKYELEENVVSFYEAVARANMGLPIIDKEYKQSEGYEFLFSMKQNEYFVFPNEKTGFDPKEIDLLNAENYTLISPNLFRIRKIQSKEYVFQHHLETKAVDLSAKNPLKGIVFHIIYVPNNLKNIVKVRVNHIGQIVSVGEY
ncbi:CRISPR-associated endonuclease Cas9 [Bacteroidia bacterium]|nr:CRISPR-associated endonuclease Cas9 [Bacteroidia bacterium]GHV42866.1 CRISPR-associated endonuclease Cas9 [Bacteroidia bacterium]